MPVESNLLKGYQTAYALAVEQLSNADAQTLARKSQAKYDTASCALRVVYLGQPYLVHWPSGNVTKIGADEEIPITTKLLILNYILSANGQPPSGELIAFRDLPGAATYEPSFNKRCLNPLVTTFDGKPDLLYAVAERLSGVKSDIADASVTIPVLPLLSVTYGIWHGDEEFPASGVILFDTCARRMLTPECLVVAAANGVYAMMALARSI